MKTYNRFEIRKRKYSANVIVGIYTEKDKITGKDKEQTDIVLITSLSKIGGDILIQSMYNLLCEKYAVMRYNNYIEEIRSNNNKTHQNEQNDINLSNHSGISKLATSPGIKK